MITYKHIYIYIYQKCSQNMKPLWKVVQIVRYNWVLVAKDKPNHQVAVSPVSLRRAGVEQLY